MNQPKKQTPEPRMEPEGQTDAKPGRTATASVGESHICWFCLRNRGVEHDWLDTIPAVFSLSDEDE